MNRSGIDANEFVAHRSSGALPLNYLQRYGLAVVSIGVALGISLLLQHFGFRVPSALLLLFAVAISSWYGGPGPAVLAALLSIISFDWYFVEPVRTLYIYRSDIPYFIVFTAFVALLSWFGTIRRRAEADLREQAALLNLTHDTVLVMDMEGVIQYWNRGARERYGWTAEQAVGRVVHDLLKTVFPAPIDQIKAEVTRTGHWEGELLHTKKDGTQVVVASRWALRRDKRGEPVAILETNNDITERKRAEEALRRLNRELRAISNCNQVLLRATDEQSLLEEICRIACEEAGYRMAWVAYAEHDEAKSVRPVAWTGAEQGYLATLGVTWADTDRGRGPTGTAIRSGKTCCIQDFATDPRLVPWQDGLLQRDFRSGIALPLKDEHGNAFGSLTIHSAQPNAFTPEEIRLLEELAADLAFGIVTLRSGAARKRAEQEVTLLSFALDKVREAAFLVDDTGRFRYVNEDGCRVLGYTREELLGMGVPDIDLEFPAGRWSDHWRDLKAQRSLNFESRHRTRDGRIFPVEISANYFEYAGHAYNLALARDITERKRAEEELRESETRFRTFVDHAGDAFFVYDLEQRTVVDVNRSACESLGYTRQELIGKTPLGFHLDSDRAEIEAATERAAAGETVVESHWHRRKDGSQFPVEAHTSLVSYGGRRFLLKVARDISDRMQAEQQREKLRQLEADLAHIDRVSVLGELAASISHDLQQPISAAIMHAVTCLQWLQRDQPDLDKVRRAAQRVVDAGQLATEITDRLRSLYKKAAPRREPIDVNEVVREMVVLLRGQAIRYAVTIRTDLNADFLTITADRVQVQQVLMNLMLNAIEAMKDSGGVLKVKSELEDSRVLISVSDTGVGLPADKADRIFDAFFTTKPQGSGMGLAISRSIVESHGGRLWATSNEGRGATFRFTLPTTTAVALAPAGVL